MSNARIGIFGGSGFYSFLDNVKEVPVDTPYGEPSSPVSIGEVEGLPVAFLPRHGLQHQFPPHMINYRANVWALKELGVERIIGPCAAGSLKRDVEPGSFVVSDQLVDRTTGRKDTFYDGPQTTHISYADPYCPELRALAIETGREEGIEIHEKGTVVTIQGPRFSTRAESKWFQDAGWEVINMTQYPGGVPRPRARDLLREHRPHHRLRRRSRGRGRGEPCGSTSRCSPRTTTSYAACCSA